MGPIWAFAGQPIWVAVHTLPTCIILAIIIWEGAIPRPYGELKWGPLWPHTGCCFVAEWAKQDLPILDPQAPHIGFNAVPMLKKNGKTHDRHAKTHWNIAYVVDLSSSFLM